MTRSTLSRRPLDFTNLAAVLTDVEALHAGGYRTAGNWDLAQCCGHLAGWVSFPVVGFPIKPFPWLVRVTVGRFLAGQVLKTRRFPAGGWTVKETVPAAGGDEAAAVERLRRSVAAFESHAGEYLPSPLFGKLSPAEWRQFHLIHCAHHLSFLLPGGGESGE
jgi:hypothetical protein